jgi:pimeloyl-ACP methyl ester carboxylesterase
MTAGTVEGAGVELAYREHGSGRAVVAVHDMAADSAAWEPSLAALGGRAVAYDRRGYGASGAPDAYAGTTVSEQAEDLAALLRGLDAAPAVLLGDGFGALVALDVAKRHPPLVAGLVLADPPLHAFVATATQAIAERRSAMEDALRAGGAEAAVAAWLGPGAPADRVARAQVALPAFFADYAGGSSWPVTRRELRAIAVPTVVLTRPGAPAHVAAAADSLASLLPHAERVCDGDPVAAAAGL